MIDQSWEQWVSRACPDCGAKVGERCRNYRGQNKQTCPGRRLAIEIAVASKKVAVMVQRTLFRETSDE